MLLAVAGLDQDKIADRTSQLATGDWSSFPASERVGYQFAQKQAKSPWEITDADVKELVDHFGTDRALDVIWWTCRCHFMTRVADGLQLPLERENVFDNTEKKTPPSIPEPPPLPEE